MNSQLPARQSAPAPRRNWTRRLVNLLVALVVVAVAAATFVFSYSGVHAIALLGGVSARLARYYPGLFDAVLVIACVAAIMLREGRWARLWAWLVIVVLLAAIAVADVLHAMNYSLRPRPTEGIVAAAPVAAVLLAFSLLLTMLRQSRPQPHQAAGDAGWRFRRAGGQAAAPTAEIPSLPLTAAEAPTAEIPELAASSQLRPPAPPIALPAAFTPPPPVADAAVPMPAPGPDAVPVVVPDIVAGIAPTREEPLIAGAGGAEPPTALTPAGPQAPAVPGAAPAPGTAPVPEAPAASGTAAGPGAAPVPEAMSAPEAAASSGTAHPEAGPDEVPATAESTPPGAASSPETPEPPTVPVPVPPRTPGGIRYAGGAAPRTARPDYWDAEEAGPYAGLVYPGRDAHPDAGGSVRAGDNGQESDNGQADGKDAPGDSASGRPPARRQPPELDDDAPPFATAPFAPVPRLNRVRSMPAPPSDEEAQPPS